MTPLNNRQPDLEEISRHLAAFRFRSTCLAIVEDPQLQLFLRCKFVPAIY